MKARVKEMINNRWLIFILRVALGGIFIAASVSKLPHQAEFINIVTGYGILPDSLARFYALVVPWAELFIGCSLVLGIFPRLASALSIPLIVSFIVASAYRLFRPVEDACGCFGQSIPISHSVSLTIDVVMLLMALQLLLHKDEVGFLSFGRLLFKRDPGLGRRGLVFEQTSKFVMVAIAVLVVGMPLLYSAPTNQLPNEPANASPAARATGVSLTPTLESSAFSDPDVGDTHAASQWQIRTDCYCNHTFDSDRDTTNLTSITIPPVTLSYNTTYYWHVRHQDNQGAWSEWSEETSFTTRSAAPTISYSPSSFSFTATEGGSNPLSQTLEIWNSEGGTLDWSVSNNATWLTLSPTSGSSTGEHDAVTLSVNSSGLAADTYNATITILAGDATNSPQTVPVTLTIEEAPPDPTIGFAPTSFSFTATEGGPDRPGQTLEIWNSGDGTLDWSVSDNATWLSLNPTSGSSTGEHDPVTVSVDISEMAAGDYSAPITIWASEATNTPRTVPVSLTINQPPHRPSNALPLNRDTDVILTPTLESSAFSDPNVGDTHAASQWQVATSSCFCTIIFDTYRDTTNLTSITIPSGTLSFDTTYYWHVRHQDNQGAWSEWSEETSFTT